jgi:charged multivesicular body protein 4A/B
MWGWFGGASAQKRKDGPKNAILMLRQQLDMLQKRERHLESQMADQDAIARKNLATNKTGKETPCAATAAYTSSSLSSLRGPHLSGEG